MYHWKPGKDDLPSFLSLHHITTLVTARKQRCERSAVYPQQWH